MKTTHNTPTAPVPVSESQHKAYEQEIKVKVMKQAILEPASTETGLLHRLDPLRDIIFAGNNNHCFIERETLLEALEKSGLNEMAPDERYCHVFDQLLTRLSTPVDANDVFLGRMVEGSRGLTDETESSMKKDRLPVNWLIGTAGHGNLDYQTLLDKGFDRIVVEMEETAESLDTEEARAFARNGRACVNSLNIFARRYAEAARKEAEMLPAEERGFLLRAAEALEHVPAKPARNFVEALHAMWLVHFVMSCVVGARDWAFGRMDQYLLPFLRRDLADGLLTRDQAVMYLAHFLLKNNEITGLASAHYRQKPIPSQGTRIYIVLGGSGPNGEDEANELSEMIMEAAGHARMPEPVINVRFAPATSMKFKLKTAEFCPKLQGQIAICNDAVIIPGYLRMGIDRADACNYSPTACSRVELGPVENNMTSVFNWLPMPVLLHKALKNIKEASAERVITLDDIYAEFGRLVKEDVEKMAERCHKLTYTCEGEKGITPSNFYSSWEFAFESLLIKDCVARGKNTSKGGVRYMILTYFLQGISTVGNSLMAVKRLVFDQNRLTLNDFLDIVDHDYKDQEEFRQEIVNRIPKFGNDDPEVDGLTSRAGILVADLIEKAFAARGLKVLPGFYSLFTHHWIGVNLQATPDGRHAGDPISENQSPTYGTDLKGPTALLKSLSRLPLDRCFTGSLNLRFSGKVKPESLVALIDTYFNMGGHFLGLNFVDRRTLQDARCNPEKYRTLYVRQYGFSEYFTALPDYEQVEFINRTEY